jgi:hypothetical protein
MRLPFESPAAAQLNKDIFEAIYFGAVSASVGAFLLWLQRLVLI